MNQLKKITSIVFDKHLYHRLVIISMVRKICFNEKNASVSAIVNTAITEYLQNHDAEIKEMMDKYHNEGGCADL